MPINEYNQAPPNLKEITEREFAQSFLFHYEPKKYESRFVAVDQLKLCGIAVKQMMPLRMMWHHDGTGVALSNDYWEGKVRFFKFATCEHKFDGGGRKLGNCFYEHTCSKCGYKKQVDSSG
jgi:hypothetical protein